MSDSLPFTPGSLPETSTPLFQVMRDIARATSPDQIVDALREQALTEVDRISLIQQEQDITGAPVGRVVAVWDRDGIALEVGFPESLHELVDDQPLVVVDTIYLDEFLAPLRLYAVDLLKASSFGIFPLKVRDETIGYLVVAARKTRLQDDQEVRLLLMVCWQIAAIMRNFVVTEAIQKQAERSAVMAETSQAIAGALTLAAAVISHFVLDWLVHIPELPVAGRDSKMLGFGLWRQLPLAWTVETALAAS